MSTLGNPQQQLLQTLASIQGAGIGGRPPSEAVLRLAQQLQGPGATAQQAALELQVKRQQLQAEVAQAQTLLSKLGQTANADGGFKDIVESIGASGGKDVSVEAQIAKRTLRAQALRLEEQGVRRVMATQTQQFKAAGAEIPPGHQESVVRPFVQKGLVPAGEGGVPSRSISIATAESINSQHVDKILKAESVLFEASLKEKGVGEVMRASEIEAAKQELGSPKEKLTRAGELTPAEKASRGETLASRGVKAGKTASRGRLVKGGIKAGAGLLIAGLLGKTLFGKEAENAGIPPEIQRLLLERANQNQIDPDLATGRQLRNQISMLKIAKMMQELQGVQAQPSRGII